MNEPERENRCAVRLPVGKADLISLDRYLEHLGLSDAARFLPKDDDDLDTAICAGRFDRVVFSSLDDLLTTIWNGDARIDQWREMGIKVDIAAGDAANGTGFEHICEMYASLEQWRARRRRRQIIASVILSTVALLAMAVLFYLVPPAR